MSTFRILLRQLENLASHSWQLSLMVYLDLGFKKSQLEKPFLFGESTISSVKQTATLI